MSESDQQVTVSRGPRMHPAPRVSVIIPAYESATLDQAVASVRAQTAAEWELIVVDDGSPRPQVPSEVSDLCLVRQPNTGPGGARNRGVALARGEFVAFLDSDDRWLPDKLERQLAAHDANPDWVLSTTDIAMVTPDGQELLRAKGRYGLEAGAIPFAKLFRENCVTTSAALARREAVQTAGGFDPNRRAAEDYALWLRLGWLGPVGYVDAVLTEHVEHEGSLTEVGQRGTTWHDMELHVYESFLAEHPELRGEGYVADALARAHFDLGYGCLQRRDWRGARDAFGASLRHRATRPATWRGLVRAWLRLAPGG